MNIFNRNIQIAIIFLLSLPFEQSLPHCKDGHLKQSPVILSQIPPTQSTGHAMYKNTRPKLRKCIRSLKKYSSIPNCKIGDPIQLSFVRLI